MKVQIKINQIIIIMCLFAVIVGCKSNQKELSDCDIDSVILETRHEYNDSMLVEKMVDLCVSKSENLDSLGFGLIYNYFVSCKNEEACEGIYDGFYKAVISDEQFAAKLCTFTKETQHVSKNDFIDKVSLELVFNYLMNEMDQSCVTDENLSKISGAFVNKIPQDVYALFYNSDIDKVVGIVAKFKY